MNHEEQSNSRSIGDVPAPVAGERAHLLESERVARQRAEASERRLSFLAEASHTLASSLDYETTLATVAQLAVPHIADWCGVHVVQDDGGVRQIALAHVDPDKVELARQLERRFPYDPDSTSGVPQVIRTHRPELVVEIPDEMLTAAVSDPELLGILRALNLRSSMIVPLIARGHVLGAITLISTQDDRLFGPDDLALAQDLATRAALAVDNARLYSSSVKSAAERAAVLDQMADGVVMADPAGLIMYANNAAYNLLGINPQDPDRDPRLELMRGSQVSGEPVTDDQNIVSRALQGETVRNVEHRFQRPGGSEIFTQSSASPVRDADGQLLGAVAVFRDVSERHELEKQKDGFLSAAAHDMQTPLATIKGHAQILERRISRMEAPDAEPLIEGLRRIDATVTRMSRSVNDLLDISRIQMGKALDLERTPTDLVALVRQVATEIQQTTVNHRITVTSATKTIEGLWDWARLERIFANLLNNAIKYSPDGGDVSVTLSVDEADDRWARASVSDKG
ncbi:MAG: GAF domain-containing protein, partial [Chloroflexota bacterium]